MRHARTAAIRTLDGDERIRLDIGRRDAVELGPEHAARRERRADADQDPDDDGRQALREHQEQDPRARRAEGTPQTDLLPSLRDRVREDAVHAEDAKAQSESREHGQEHRSKAPLRQRLRHAVFERPDRRHWQGRVDLADGAAKGFGERDRSRRPSAVRTSAAASSPERPAAFGSTP